jgi:hypothetical protein
VTQTIPAATPQTLLPLHASPQDDPLAWAEAAALGAGGVAVINLSGNALAGSDPGARARLAEGIDRLVAAGVEPLGQVSLGYATRPVVDLVGEITGWAVLPVVGIFLDHAPAGPFQIGPVALAARIARRAGLHRLVLNPGVPVDPMYRRLDLTICTFEGPWNEYRERSGEDTQAGDGHLVYRVPPREWDLARRLIAQRGAGLALVSERPGPYLRPSVALDQITKRPAHAGAGLR